MCAGTPPSNHTTIGLDWTDEQILLFLAERKNEDPLPSNVSIDVNPFIIEPWIAPDQTWFLCKPERPNGCTMIFQDAGSGYWKEMDANSQIFSGPQIEGRKISWEFHAGDAPSGIQTGWTMLEYKMDQKDLSSLCCVYWRNVDTPLLPLFEEEHNGVGVDVESEYLESALLRCLENEESCSPVSESTNGSLVVHGNEQGTLSTSSRKQLMEPNNNSTHFLGTCDFTNGDFLELKDFDNDLESPSSSDNSSSVSITSDEVFDSDALLCDLENEYYQIKVESQKDSKLRVSSSPRVDHTVPRPTSSGGLPALASETQQAQPASPSVVASSIAESSSGKDVTSRHRKAGRAKRPASASPQSSGSSRQSSRSPVGRIAKLGKKYCCFGSLYTQD